MKRILIATVLALAGALALPSVAHADTSDFTFDSFDADYTLTRLPDGAAQLTVVETIVARFPDFDQNRGIVRAIPDDYDGVALETSVSSVTDQAGVAVPYETSAGAGAVVLALGTDDFVQGKTTYVISYTQNNVVRSFADTDSDEFYWDVNGVGWDQPFGRVTAAVHVDPSLVDALSGQAACYAGAEGDAGGCDIQSPTLPTSAGQPSSTAPPPAPDDAAPVDPGSTAPAEYRASVGGLNPRETLTVAIGFAPGTFVIPEAAQNAPVPIQRRPPIPVIGQVLPAGIGLLSLGGVAAAIVSRVRSRGPRGRGTIIPQYSEPPTTTILQAATLVKRDSAAIPAAIVRLAVRKNIRILAYQVTSDGEPYSLQFLAPAEGSFEDASLLERIFGAEPTPGDVRDFGQSEQERMRRLNELAGLAKSSLLSDGFLKPAPGRRTGSLLVGLQVLLGFVAAGVLSVLASSFSGMSGLLIGSIFIVAVAFIITTALAIRPPNLTPKGLEARDFLLGMRMYLTLAEKDRFRALQSPEGAERIDVDDNRQLIKLYEKLLPWAVLWGVEDQWSRELAVRVDESGEKPDWLVGTDTFNPFLIAALTSHVASSLVPPSTSGSGGWSGGGSFSGGSFGGGFSGGGGGGGGGGGR